MGDLVRVLNPNKEEGHLMIITRYGAGKVEEFLTQHIAAVKETGVPVVWQCDAVHGNGIVAKSNNFKTRRMDDIVAEVCERIAVHKKCGSILAGIHLEATGQETVTYCDPRLNYSQGIETVFKVA